MPALFVLTSGCASIPPSVSDLPDAAQTVELEATPFYPQERYQCGPAALTTVLVASGAAVTLDDIVKKVYLPGRQGSLQFELLAAARTEGRLPYPVDGTLSTIWQELEAGRPVLVLQNLGVSAIPRWHYAVVVGIDTENDEVVLRSGTDERRVTPTRAFLHTWRRGGYWGLVALKPGELPAAVDRARYFEAVAALEEAGRAEAATAAWGAALSQWPGDTVALFGLANANLALRNFAAAEDAYRTLLDRDSSLLAARNNLALALAEQGEFDAALQEISVALSENRDAAVDKELRDTEATIRRRKAIAD
ncbi:MAG: PA2778 family cysteine peptidase [Gammaproteobacteria bacterium]|nr:PA2778 family cysteine peptidase [Gammaproteobacteria bacterium]